MFNVKMPIAFATVLLTAVNCLAEATNAVPTASERRAAWLKKVGGFCEGETKGKHFLYLNCADIDDSVFNNVIDQMKQVCGIALRHSREQIVGEPLSYARSVLQARRDVGAVAIFYKGPADLPIEAIYPMDKISIVNVTPISGSSKEAFSARATALACRSVAYTAGGAMPFGVEGCMKNVFSPKDIDSLKSKLLHPMSGQLVKSSASDFGFALWKRGTYLAACQGGWAHEPTNELQRTIWNDIRKLPEKPLTIEFDPLKGR